MGADASTADDAVVRDALSAGLACCTAGRGIELAAIDVSVDVDAMIGNAFAEDTAVVGDEDGATAADVDDATIGVSIADADATVGDALTIPIPSNTVSRC